MKATPEDLALALCQPGLSPERTRELVAALDSVRVDQWLGTLAPDMPDGELAGALAAFERRSWRDDQVICPARWVPLSDYQHAVLHVNLIAAIESRGGSFDVTGESYRRGPDGWPVKRVLYQSTTVA